MRRERAEAVGVGLLLLAIPVALVCAVVLAGVKAFT